MINGFHLSTMDNKQENNNSAMQAEDPLVTLMSVSSTIANDTLNHIQQQQVGASPSTLQPMQQQAIQKPNPSTINNQINCVSCSYPGADLRLVGSCKCAYHARCLDLFGICAIAKQQQQQQGGDESSVLISTCPNCLGPTNGIEIIPLSFVELDRAQKVKTTSNDSVYGGMMGVADSTNGMSKKRSSREFSLPTGTNQYNPISQSECYDPSVHRTGRWTNEELAFRDAIIALFVEGSLPLSNGIKLNDFLSSILKSKQSRLTKKMKHAKLSSKYFRIKQGHLTPTLKAKEFSTLEHNFINAVPDLIERSEIQFHMQKEWRDHIAERLTNMHISFSADRWLHSVEIMDRRVALEKNRSRMAKRRCLMGLAMERDVKDVTEGVFINQDVKGGHDFLLDMDKSGAVMGGNMPGDGSSLGVTAANTTEDGDFGRFLMSMLDEAPIAPAPSREGNNTLPSTGVLAGGKKALRSSCDPNFRYAAPFLAGITSYIERNSVPFEHVDLWVPSTVPKELESESSRPLVGSMGSGSNTALFGMSGVVGNTLGVTRLCFAGSATLGTQIVAEVPATNTMGNENIEKAKATTIPLSDDEIFNFSLYGDYSAKFSFSSGCGLPGRVFQSGIAAWEQYLTNAPPEMFERTGGAIQFGVRTALGLPIDSPTVGRIVLVLYSKHNREKDVDLVNRIVRGVRLFNPSPRWKLVVDICSDAAAADGENPLPVDAKPPTPQQPPKEMTNSSSLTGMSALSMNQNESLGLDIDEGNNMNVSDEKNKQIVGLVNLLQEYMPSSDTDLTSPLGKQLNNMLLLRMLLLKPNRKPEDEEELVETMLVLYESYLAAGRTRPDLAILIARDYNFQLQHTRTMANLSQPQS